MDVDKPRAELGERCNVVDLLPDEVGGFQLYRIPKV